MSGDEDYLSDAFLVQANAVAGPKTYTERRRLARIDSERKNVEHRRKSRRELEEQSRQEGLGKSLFERAQEDTDGKEHKAMAMMIKMGFQPGKALGTAASEVSEGSGEKGHRAEPLPLHIWQGKQGLGKRKRAISPGSSTSRMPDVEQDPEAFRNRARAQYAERRDEARLANAIKACKAMDEKANVTFNHLWLDPLQPDSLVESLADASDDGAGLSGLVDGPSPSQLKAEMRANRLRKISNEDDSDEQVSTPPRYRLSEGDMKLVKEHCLLRTGERLGATIAYLRNKYYYCYWCGTRYSSASEMGNECPGVEEDMHD